MLLRHAPLRTPPTPPNPTQPHRPLPPALQETAAATRTIRAAKAREHALRLEGVAGAKAGRIAAALVSGSTKHKHKKRRKGSVGGEGGEGGAAPGGSSGGGLFSGDGLSRPGGAAAPSSSGRAKVYGGGARSSKARPPKVPGALSKAELGRARRGGKGKAAFKSKARHKRRK